MGNKIHEVALVICTRNRPNQLKGCIKHILRLPQLPGEILVVDSSDSPTCSKEVIASFPGEQISLLLTTPGLPHQRLAGLQHLKRSGKVLKALFFVDDDVRPCPTFFSSAMEAFERLDGCDLISGWDVQRGEETFTQRLIWKRFGFESTSSGALLKSGVGIMPLAKNEDWCPINLHSGMAFGVRFEALKEEYFNANLRMIGEDLDFFVRGGFSGRGYTGRTQAVQHLESSINRDSERVRHKHDMALRRQLSKEFPDHVSFGYVFVWDVLMTLRAVIMSVFSSKQRQILLGTLDFIYASLMGRETMDLVAQ